MRLQNTMLLACVVCAGSIGLPLGAHAKISAMSGAYDGRKNDVPTASQPAKAKPQPPKKKRKVRG